MADTITITYALGDPANAPNDCSANTTYKGEEVKAAGASWVEAKDNAIARCKHLKALGDPPAAEVVDLDPPAAG